MNSKAVRAASIKHRYKGFSMYAVHPKEFGSEGKIACRGGVGGLK